MDFLDILVKLALFGAMLEENEQAEEEKPVANPEEDEQKVTEQKVTEPDLKESFLQLKENVKTLFAAITDLDSRLKKLESK